MLLQKEVDTYQLELFRLQVVRQYGLHQLT